MSNICMLRFCYQDVRYDSRVLREADVLSKENKVIVIDVLACNKQRFEKIGNIQIERIDLLSKALPQGGVWGLIRYAEFIIRASMRALFKKCDVYHAHDLPTLLPALVAAKINNSKVIYDSHEIYTEVDFLSPKIRKIWKYIERHLVKHVDQIIVANQIRAKVMGEAYDVTPKVSVIMNCPEVDYSKKYSQCSDEIRKSFSLKGLGMGKIVLYQGGLISGRCLENLVLAAKYFDDGIVLVLLGEGDYKKQLEDLAIKQDLQDKVFFHDYIPSFKLLDYTASADLGVIIYKNNCLNNYYCAPNKLFEYAVVGLPVAACDFPELESIVSKYKIGKLFDPENILSIATVVNSILSDGPQYVEMSQNTGVVREKYNWANERQKLIEIYNKLDTGACHST